MAISRNDPSEEQSGYPIQPGHRMAFVFAATFLAFVSAASAQNSALNPALPSPPSNQDSRQLDQDRQTGALLSRSIDAQNDLITDPQVLDYVNRLGQSLISHSGKPMPFAVTIKILHTDRIGAFTLPGGYVYLTSGLIVASNSEAEVAGVLAHEIAHIAAKHDPKLQRQRRIWNVAAHCSGPAGVAVGFAGYLSTLKASRDAEREADFLGIQNLVAAGYNPKGFVDFLQTPQFEKEEGHGLAAGAFASYPVIKERTFRADREITTMQLQGIEQLVLDTGEFEEIRARIAALDDPSS